MAEGREARESALRAARRLARTDPAGLAGLWDRLDERGRCGLARALGSAGTRHAAMVALRGAGLDPSPEIFQALLEGLADGGEKAIFAELPEGVSPRRRSAIRDLRLRWRVEAELAALKSPAGPTGHYTGQFAEIRKLGSPAIPIFLDIVADRRRPLAGEGGAGPYQSIHPDMVRFDRGELRDLAAHGFGEITDPGDIRTIQRLLQLWTHYWEDFGEDDFERSQLAPALAFSLHDLEVRGPGREYIRELNWRARGSGIESLRARWSLGYAHIRLGDYKTGERYYRDLLSDESVSRYLAAYNLACNYSMQAMRDPKRRNYFKRLALRYLERAVHDFGYWDWPWMQADGDLDFIREEPRYKAILEFLKQKWPDRRKGKVGKKLTDFLGEERER
jgi:hypothetical protein